MSLKFAAKKKAAEIGYCSGPHRGPIKDSIIDQDDRFQNLSKRNSLSERIKIALIDSVCDVIPFLKIHNSTHNEYF